MIAMGMDFGAQVNWASRPWATCGPIAEKQAPFVAMQVQRGVIQAPKMEP